MIDKTFLVKEEITLRGTSHDPRGMITLTSQCDGVNICKNTEDLGHESITLTLRELKGIVEAVYENFNQRDDV